MLLPLFGGGVCVCGIPQFSLSLALSPDLGGLYSVGLKLRDPDEQKLALKEMCWGQAMVV